MPCVAKCCMRSSEVNTRQIREGRSERKEVKKKAKSKDGRSEATKNGVRSKEKYGVLTTCASLTFYIGDDQDLCCQEGGREEEDSESG